MICSCGKKASYRCATPKHLLTTVGGMNIPRRYYACRHCRQKFMPWDDWAGVDAIQVTPHARKVIVTVATAWSFDRASIKLKDICSMSVSDDTIERLCQHEGGRARKWLRGEETTVQAFAQTPGEPEFYSDGLKINTTGGWREMRLNLLQKRECAAPATPQQWNDRVLPEAGMRLASCAIADSRLTGAMWEQWSEHIYDCAKTIFGEGESARSWWKRQLQDLIQTGGPKFIATLDVQIVACQDESHRQTLTRLRGYLHANRDRMWYADRLQQGKPIGSGAIEGACKKIGARLKLNSARWRPRRAERFGAMLCVDYADQSETYWQARAA